MTEETWLPIVGYERYEVSDHGRVRTLIKKVRIMNIYTHWKGYKHIYLYALGKGTDQKCFIHRLVAIAFLPNPSNLPIVNHKDLDKANNHVSNLEWTDESGNMHHWRNARKEISEYDHIPF